MNTFRYAIALISLCLFIPLFFYWPIIHGGISLWRRLGVRVTYTLVGGVMAAGAIAVYQVRDFLLGIDLGTNPVLMTAGVVCIGIAARVRLLLHREISTTFLLGLPEVSPVKNPQPLVCTGLYAQVRHPRYLQLLIALSGWALFVNYLAPYLILLLWLPAVYLVAVLEERELRERYGEEYVRYCRQVPRFIPRCKSI